MNPIVPIPKVHQIKGLTDRRSENMSWALTLLRDLETLQTYEEYARESAYEADGAQPPNPLNRKHQNHVLPEGGQQIATRGQSTQIKTQGMDQWGPQAWILTRNRMSGPPLRVPPLMTASHHEHVAVFPLWNPPHRSKHGTSSFPSTPHLETQAKQITTQPTAANGQPTNSYPSRSSSRHTNLSKININNS